MKTFTTRLYQIFPFLLIVSLLIGIFTNIVSKNEFGLSALVVTGLYLFLVFLKPLKKLLNRLSQKSINRVIVLTMIVVLIVQIIIIKYLPATVIHDPFRVLFQAEQLSQNNFDWSYTTYFYRYAQNVPNAILLSFWLRLTNLFGLTTNFAVHLLSIILLDSFIFTSLKIIQKISRSNTFVIFMALFYLLTPFAYTYFLQVFYSDLPILLVLLLVFKIIFDWNSLSKNRRISALIAIFFLVLIGQMVKASLIVLAVAIIIFIIYLAFNNRKILKKYTPIFAAILLAFAAWMPVQKGLEHVNHYQQNTAFAFPTTHWIYMSYNLGSHGEYNAEDVKTMLNLPTENARAKYLKTALPKRLKKLGFAGILHRWFTKNRILLNVSTLSKAYTGGFRQAPTNYQNHEQQFSLTGQVIYRIFTIIIYCLTVISLIKLVKIKQKNEQQLLTIFAVIVAVGYLAFHTLLWEVENRYGQAISPLLLIIVAQMIAVPDTITSKLHSPLINKIFIGLTAIASLVFAFISRPLKKPRLIVNAQRSQLSQQYDVRPTFINNTEIVTQNVQLNHSANRGTIIMARDTNVVIKLISLSSYATYNFVKNGPNYILNHDLPSGNYQIVLEPARTSFQAQNIAVTKTDNYLLAASSLKVDDKSFRYQSLIYTFSNSQK